MPEHVLSISSAHGEPRLINRGINITTNYIEFETFLTQEKSLERADEWHFALKDYISAFNSLRGESFKKMYGNWSESMRRYVLNKLETELVHFAKICVLYNNKKDARRVLEKVSAIIPYIQKVEKILRES